MGIQYEAHKVYFYYAFVKYDIIGYITSPYSDEWNQLLLYIKYTSTRHTRLQIPIYFHIYVQQNSLYLVLAAQILFFAPKYVKVMHKHEQ